MRKWYLLNLILCIFFSAYTQDLSDKNLIEIYEQSEPQKKWENLTNLFSYYKQTNFAKADSLKHKLLKEAQQHSKYAVMRTKEELSILAYYINRNTTKLDTFLQESRKYLKEIKNPIYKAELYVNLGRQLLIENKKDSAKLIFRKAIALANESNNYAVLAKVYRRYATILNNEGYQDSNLYYLDKAIPYAKRCQNKIYLIRIYDKLHYAYRANKIDDKALNFAIKATDAALKNNLLYTYSTLSNKVGYIQKINGNLSEALYYYKNALDKSDGIGAKRLSAKIAGNIGTVLKEMKKYAEAIKYHKRAIKTYTEIKDIKNLGDANTNLGIVYNKEQKYKLAIKHYKIALKYFTEVNNQERISRALHNMGRTLYSQNKSEKALPILNRALKIKLANNYASKYSTYALLSNVMANLKRYDKAYEYLSIYHEYKDSLNASKTKEKLAKLSAQYRAEKNYEKIQEQKLRLEKQEQENQIYEKELEVTALKNNQKTYIILAILIVTLLLILLGYNKYKQIKLREKRNQSELNQSLLRTQMNPHFIFNAMSVIQSYIYDNDVKNSSKFLVNFSKLMRLILENSPKEFIPLSVEKDILEKYLLIQKLRFESLFDFNIDIDEDLLKNEALIPPMLTQPFIENALEHGRLDKIKNGLILIKIKKLNQKQLKIDIVDNGVGIANTQLNLSADNKHRSMAMQITKERISLLNSKYKTEGYMQVAPASNKDKSGTHVQLIIPLKINNLNT